MSLSIAKVISENVLSLSNLLSQAGFEPMAAEMTTNKSNTKPVNHSTSAEVSSQMQPEG